MIALTYILLIALMFCVSMAMHGVALWVQGYVKSGVALLFVYVFNIVIILMCLSTVWNELGGLFYV